MDYARCLLVLLAVAAPSFGENFRVATWNVKFFFDHRIGDNHAQVPIEMSAPSSQDWAWRVAKVAEVVAALDADVVALQEIEDADVLHEVVEALPAGSSPYLVSFVQGADSITEQDVAFLVRSGLVFQGQRVPFSRQGNADFKDLSKHQLLTVEVSGQPVSLLNVHLITDGNKRMRQARTLREWIDDLGLDSHVIVLGDTNVSLTYEQTFPNSDIGRIRGLHSSPPQDDLEDLHAKLSEAARPTHQGGRELDRVLLSSKFAESGGLEYRAIANRKDLVLRGSQSDGASWAVPESERDLSDHYPLVVDFEVGPPTRSLAFEERKTPESLPIVTVGSTNDRAIEVSTEPNERPTGDLTAVQAELDRLIRRIEALERELAHRQAAERWEEP